MSSYSSPNRMVWHYFEALRRAVARSHNEQQPSGKHQEIVVAVFLAVATVETFLNVFFRVLAEADGYRHHRQRLLDDLGTKKSLDYIWKLWPKLFFSRAISANCDPSRRFLELKGLRNRLMHFTSSNDTVVFRGNILEGGLSETSAIDDLSVADADRALKAAEDAIQLVLV